ncbi:hypothetical protein GGD54_005996 [Rhizobium tropici]|uniref:Uncharacterized protein n=2 Tax=Rhizobium TaxID=379 RepID=A0ABR6R8T6_RHITR|nr:hypothetical protein [Rhizobium tropici]MBB5596614.1 hypothetical protein [Rhizobium tropici]MBB6489330.1 hypothetical protein [Rhizobium lusitanum]MBB6495561.1 hypothetical protein [Rhizobium tropici]
MLVLDVADDGLDGWLSSHLSFDGRRHAALLWLVKTRSL